MRAMWSGIFILGLMNAATPTLAAEGNAPSGAWYVTKAEWTEADEKGFGEFVRAIGHSGCTTSVACLKDPANPYRSSDPKELKFLADCADFPYMLRAYYAWKNGLPFGYVNGVSGKGSDIRFDLTGTSDQVRGPFNCVPSGTQAATYFAVFTVAMLLTFAFVALRV